MVFGLAGVGGAIAADRVQGAVLFCFGDITVNVNELSGGVSGSGSLTCDEPGGPRHSATIRMSGSVLSTSGLITETVTSDTITYDDGQVSDLGVNRRLEKLSSSTHGNARGAGSGRVSNGRFVNAVENEQASGTFATGIAGTTTYRFGDFSLGLSR
ncbi:hypothetical protein [Streptomyces sp. NPDC021096]|uniref:hypothetical protein n=1 Tax=Streptomyces sp. NPDC021096 TaxID=3154792 RepID=UPI0033CFB1D1